MKTPESRIRIRRRPARPIFISKLSVLGLFGRIDYPEIRTSFPGSDSNMTVIYGDNGSGKTTILKLLYSCLFPISGDAVRTYISKTPFRKFEVTFDDESYVRVIKLNGLTGSYDFTVKIDDFHDTINLPFDEELDIQPRPENVQRLDRAISLLKLEILFVDHERSVRSTSKFIADITRNREQRVGEFEIYTSTRSNKMQQPRQFPLTEIAEAVNSSFRDEAFQQGNIGEVGASNVYLEISKALIRPKKPGKPTSPKMPLNEILAGLARRALSYQKHGLLPSYPFDEISSVYESATPRKKVSIDDALVPFVNSIERRLKALDSLNNLISNFEEELNKYLSAKSASVTVQWGLVISDVNGNINLDLLSSGEKQLIFLFCAAILSRSKRSLILIDEPELSLNYKWQRLIAGSLSRLSSQSLTQFIMASHSIEVITKFKNSSCELTNANS